MRTLEADGRHETAHRTKSRCSQVFRYAVATGRADGDPTADLRGALAPVSVTNRAALTDPRQVGDLLRAIDSYTGQPATIAALKLAPMVFLRPGELRAAEWQEIDLDARQRAGQRSSVRARGRLRRHVFGLRQPKPGRHNAPGSGAAMESARGAVCGCLISGQNVPAESAGYAYESARKKRAAIKASSDTKANFPAK